jgi:pimeloyl-ACP methyl ester carboxylesterase
MQESAAPRRPGASGSWPSRPGGKRSPPAMEATEVGDLRLRQAQADLSLEELTGTDHVCEGTPAASVEALGASMRAFHPSGFRAMASAAENLRDALPSITVPTATLPVLPNAGHLCNIEGPGVFIAAVRSFLLR